MTPGFARPVYVLLYSSLVLCLSLPHTKPKICHVSVCLQGRWPSLTSNPPPNLRNSTCSLRPYHTALLTTDEDTYAPNNDGNPE